MARSSRGVKLTTTSLPVDGAAVVRVYELSAAEAGEDACAPANYLVVPSAGFDLATLDKQETLRVRFVTPTAGSPADSAAARRILLVDANNTPL